MDAALQKLFGQRFANKRLKPFLNISWQIKKDGAKFVIRFPRPYLFYGQFAFKQKLKNYRLFKAIIPTITEIPNTITQNQTSQVISIVEASCF